MKREENSGIFVGKTAKETKTPSHRRAGVFSRQREAQFLTDSR